MADLTHAQELKLDALTETIWTLINEDGIDPEIILAEVETAIDTAGENGDNPTGDPAFYQFRGE